MRFSTRSSVVVFGLLLVAFCSPAAKASADEASPEGWMLDIQAPVSNLTIVSFDTADASLPDDPAAGAPQQAQAGNGTTPAASTTPGSTAPTEGRQTKRILYVVPNFRAVSADQHLPPQSVKEKFKTAMLDSMDYSAFTFVAAQAGIALADNSYPEFGEGAIGYGRYYWHLLADEINENAWVEFIVPSALHQDTRYYTLGKGPFAKRLGYAVSRIAITRTDSGHETFNASELLGAGAFAGLANLYYPSQERTVTKTYQRWITNIAIDGCTFAFKEVWPTSTTRFSTKKIKPPPSAGTAAAKFCPSHVGDVRRHCKCQHDLVLYGEDYGNSSAQRRGLEWALEVHSGNN